MCFMSLPPLFIKSKNTVDRDLKMQVFLILVLKASLLSHWWVWEPTLESSWLCYLTPRPRCARRFVSASGGSPKSATSYLHSRSSLECLVWPPLTGLQQQPLERSAGLPCCQRSLRPLAQSVVHPEASALPFRELSCPLLSAFRQVPVLLSVSEWSSACTTT